MLRLNSEASSEKTEDHEQPQRQEALGSKRKSTKSQEDKDLKRRVLGGEQEFTQSLLTSKKKTRQSRRRKAASLNTARPVWEDKDDAKNSEKFEKLMGTPKWAKASEPAADDDDDSDLEQLASSTGTLLDTSSSLVSTYINIKRCPDGNTESPSTGKLTSVRFHKTARVLMTASTDKSIRLFQVDGTRNTKIQTVFFKNYPVMSAEFSATGEEVITGSKHRGFYVFDMLAEKAILIPKIKALEETNMSRLRITPDGRFIVFLGSYGNIHLLSAKSKEWIHTLHMNGGVTDVSFSSDGSTMFGTGDDGRISVFDLTTRQCVHQFIDDGCVRGTSIALSGSYLACGSNTGVVNVYDKDTCMMSRSPQPLKAITNLQTSCTTAVMNYNTEILALASNLTEKAVKLVHMPSLTVFANFPDLNDTKIRIPWTMDFSPNGGYFSIGNQKGYAPLYRVKHYGNY